MQGFCPLCLENGITTKVKAFQLSFEEAVFMCSNAKCPWPVGCEELTFINRSIGKDWSKSWEKLEAENLKKYSKVEKTVSNWSTACADDNVCTSQEDSTTISKPCDFSLNINISNGSNLALLPVDLEPVKCKAKASPTRNNEESYNAFAVDSKSTNLDNAVTTTNSNSTSLVNNFVPAKANSLNCNLSRLSKSSKLLSLRSKVFKVGREKAHPYKKFSLNDLQKENSTNAEKETKLALVAATKTRNTENSNELTKILSDSGNETSSDSNFNFENVSCNSETVTNGNSDINLDELLNSYCSEINTKADVENKDDYDWIESLLF